MAEYDYKSVFGQRKAEFKRLFKYIHKALIYNKNKDIWEFVDPSTLDYPLDWAKVVNNHTKGYGIYNMLIPNKVDDVLPQHRWWWTGGDYLISPKIEAIVTYMISEGVSDTDAQNALFLEYYDIENGIHMMIPIDINESLIPMKDILIKNRNELYQIQGYRFYEHEWGRFVDMDRIAEECGLPC